MTQILIVDHDASFRQQLTNYLGEHAYQVDAIDSMALLQTSPAPRQADLIIVDVTREHESETGAVHDLCANADIPVIVTSADKTAEDDKVTALERGAADYIVKPFGMREVLARIRVALRDRPQARIPQHIIYTFDNWRLNTRHRRLKDASGLDVKLTVTELNLLIAFLRSPRQILSREQLLLATRVHDQEIFDRSIDVLILRLRRKLGETPSCPRYIKTERRAGYVFDADVDAERLRTRTAKAGA